MYNYPLAIEVGDDTHAYGVQVPDIPGCFSAGDTLDEAIEQAHEAIQGHLGILAEDGELPPAPTSVTNFADRKEYKSGYIWAIASIDETPFMGRSIKFNVTLPSLIANEIDGITNTHPEYKNRSHFLQEASKKLLKWEQMDGITTLLIGKQKDDIELYRDKYKQAKGDKERCAAFDDYARHSENLVHLLEAQNKNQKHAFS